MSDDRAASDRSIVVYLGLGSNLGDRAGHLRYALRQLRAHGRLTGLSSVYHSEPVGYIDQPPYLNMVVRLETTLSPHALLRAVLDIERRRGRLRTFPNAPRTLDIDILTQRRPAGSTRPEAGPDATVIHAEGLRVPHPRMAERPFVLVPLLEVEPELVDPETDRPYSEYLAELLSRHAPDGGSGESERVEGAAAGPRLRPEVLKLLGLERRMDGIDLVERAEEEAADG